MTYSRHIDGARDARVLAVLFRRLRLALVRDQHGVATVQQAAGGQILRQEPLVAPRESAPADIKPNGQATTALKQGVAILTAPGVCRALPSRTKAGAELFVSTW